MIESTPRFIQGMFSFTGAGYAAPTIVASYTIAADRRAQPIYLRAGNSSAELVNLTLMRDGAPMRLFPIGAKAAMHVQLAVVEDVEPAATLSIAVAAPDGVDGTLVVDFGMVEI